MSFQFTSNKNPASFGSPDWGLLMIRLVLVTALAYYQILNQIQSAWAFLWNHRKWDLVNQIEGLTLPFPQVIAVSLVFLICLSMMGLTIGIFTRINALVLALLLGFVLVAPRLLSSSLSPQTLALNIGILLGLLFSGAGRFSLDYYLASRKAKAVQRH